MTPPMFGRDSRRVRERMEYRNASNPVAHNSATPVPVITAQNARLCLASLVLEPDNRPCSLSRIATRTMFGQLFWASGTFSEVVANYRRARPLPPEHLARFRRAANCVPARRPPPHCPYQQRA